VWAKGDKKPKKPKKAGPNPALLAKVKELDGFRCRFCGRVDSLHVHHIVYRSQGGTHDEANLITLCVQHHELVHSNKTLYAPICEEIVNRRTVSGDKTTLIASLL
jgi:5-methylcytosine-specific restriction endonuclease McrA